MARLLARCWEVAGGACGTGGAGGGESLMVDCWWRGCWSWIAGRKSVGGMSLARCWGIASGGLLVLAGVLAGVLAYVTLA